MEPSLLFEGPMELEKNKDTLEMRIQRLEADMAQVMERLEPRPGSASQQGGQKAAAAAHLAKPTEDDCVVVPVSGPPGADLPPLTTSGESASCPEAIQAAGGGTYVVERSVWSGALFIGLPLLGWPSSFVLVFMMMTNVMGQGVFLFTTWSMEDNFIQNSPPSAEFIRDWRATEGHDLKNVYAGHSLTQRVCSRDPSLSVASTQTSIAADASAYLTPGVLRVPFGVMLTTFILLLWYLKICEEFSLISNFCIAVLNIPRAGRTEVYLHEGESLYFHAMSRHRLLFVLALAFVRTAVAVTLLVSGSIWLAHTANLENLVLNGAALSFVLELDELLFSALAPERCAVIAEKMEPLPVPKVLSGRSFAGIGVKPIALFVFGLAFLSQMLSGYVYVTHDSMRELNDTMCAGDQSFAFTVHPTHKVVMVAPSDTVEKEMARYRVNVVGNYSHRGQINDTLAPYIDPSGTADTLTQIIHWPDIGAMEYWVAQTPEAILAPYPCTDDEVLFQKWLGILRILTRDDNISQCSDMWPDHCHNTDLMMPRSICPRTCRCDSPLEGPPRWDGCIPACKITREYVAELEGIECEDRTPPEILASPLGQRFQASFGTLDCSQVQPRMCLDPETMSDGSLLYHCPRSCGCMNHSGGRSGCPPRCG